MQQPQVHAGIFQHPDLEELKKAFFKKFTLIEAAGGLVKNKENKILIKIFTKDNALHCSIFNTKELQQADASKASYGIGITNLKRRLELLHPERYKLTTDVGNEFYETNLILDLK